MLLLDLVTDATAESQAPALAEYRLTIVWIVRS